MTLTHHTLTPHDGGVCVISHIYVLWYLPMKLRALPSIPRSPDPPPRPPPKTHSAAEISKYCSKIALPLPLVCDSISPFGHGVYFCSILSFPQELKESAIDLFNVLLRYDIIYLLVWHPVPRLIENKATKWLPLCNAPRAFNPEDHHPEPSYSRLLQSLMII